MGASKATARMARAGVGSVNRATARVAGAEVGGVNRATARVAPTIITSTTGNVLSIEGCRAWLCNSRDSSSINNKYRDGGARSFLREESVKCFV
jgi:hypothetical protein